MSTFEMDSVSRRRDSLAEGNWGFSEGPESIATNDDIGYGMALHTGRRRTISAVSDVTNAMGPRRVDDDVTQLGNDHYMIRRRATKIYVKGFPQMDKLEALHEEATLSQQEKEAQTPVEEGSSQSAWSLFSSLYALHIILLMTVLKTTQFTTHDVDAVFIDYFLIVLYTLSLIWTIACRPLATACYQHKARIGFAKSNHVNNRWLKGVLCLFGLAIIIKDGLEFIAFLGIDNPLCEEKALYATVPVIHAIFIICQVNFLFQYSKVYIQDFQALARFGVMQVVATNMSIWIATIADETEAALMHSESQHSTSNDYVTEAPHNNNLSLLDSPIRQAYSGYPSFSPAHYPIERAGGQDILFSGNCTCEQEFCAVVAVAEAFLFPFVIEFSLVACCLLYVTWRNIGKAPHVCEHIVKPSYKFYRSYKGAIFGGLAIFACIVVMVVLGTGNSGLPAEERTYFTESRYLTIYNIFLIVFELTMVAASLLGFYLFKKNSNGFKSGDEDHLDSVLLMLCLVGPVLVGLFNILANSITPENKVVNSWFLNVIWPFCDIFQCVVQVLFILYGMRRAPLTSDDDLETAAEVKRVQTAAVRSNTSEFGDDGRTTDGQSYYGGLSNRFGIASGLRPAALMTASLTAIRSPPMERMDEIESLEEQEEDEKIKEPSFQPQQNSGNSNTPSSSRSDPVETTTGESSARGDVTNESAPQVAVVGPMRDHNSNDRKSPIGRARERVDSDSGYDNTVFMDDLEGVRSDVGTAAYGNVTNNMNHPIKIVTETKVAHPDRSRLLLRNVVIYLIVSNACLWMFWSLEGTAFLVYTYNHMYYSTSVWTTIAMICRPLSIFFRMHSAACLFEIWSFA